MSQMTENEVFVAMKKWYGGEPTRWGQGLMYGSSDGVEIEDYKLARCCCLLGCMSVVTEGLYHKAAIERIKNKIGGDRVITLWNDRKAKTLGDVEKLLDELIIETT